MENSGGHRTRPGIAVIGGGEATRRWYLPEISATEARLVMLATRTEPGVRLAGLIGGEEPTVMVGPEAWRHAVLHPEVSAVVIATPNHLHAEIAEVALRHGRHVLVEKPLCTDSAAAERLCGLAHDHAGAISAVAYKHRYLPHHARAKELLRDGSLGRPQRVHAKISHAGPLSWSPGSTWFFDARRAGGGCLIDLSVHKLDSCSWLLGDHIVAAAADLDRGAADSVEHRATGVFELSSGTSLTVEASWETAALVDELRIEMSGGWLQLSGKEELRWARADGYVHEETHPAPRNAAGTVASGVFAAFVAAVAGDRPADDLPSFEEGATHVRAVMAAYESRGSSKRVSERAS
jgi:UDP-N-acetylglucosamine 3-dehydrogenase